MDEPEYHNVSRMERSHWWYSGMGALAEEWVRGLPLAGGARRRILDAGCGTGGALEWLRGAGIPYGVDLHPLPLRLASTRRSAPLARADLQALPFGTGSFDLVTCLDVLYHRDVTRDTHALGELARVLRPGGWLLLRVPAHDWLRGAHDRAVHTRHRYGRTEVLKKLLEIRLRPVRATYANALLFLPSILWRTLTRSLPSATGSDVRPLPGLLNSFLAAILRLENRWMRRFDLPIGLSVLALAQKGPT